MSLHKLQKVSEKKGYARYQIILPKQIVEEIAKWRKGTELAVEWIPKGKHETVNKPYFRISIPDNFWVDKKRE